MSNSDINCHKALNEGKVTMRKMVGQNFGELKLSRKNKVSSLASMNCTIKISNVVEVVDPLLIFQRVAISKKNDENIQDLLCYELAPFPLSLFDDKGMRKTKKSALYDIFTIHPVTPDLKIHTNVIDGGFLIHRVRWGSGSTFSVILNQYVNYIRKHYGECCTVVFDGYKDTGTSTKRAEQRRRTSSVTASVDVDLTEDMSVTIQQQQFLSNERNKEKFIQMLSKKLLTEGIEVRQADADADIAIVQCTLEKAKVGCATTLIGEDVDLLVLLIALTPRGQQIWFFKPGKGNEEGRTYSTIELQDKDFAKHILFIHAFSGCDTTSAIFRKGKTTVAKLVMRNIGLQIVSNVFYSTTATQQAVQNAGEQMFLAMYNGRVADINKQRYAAFIKSTTKIKPDLPSLPPTKGAAIQHSYRVYHQVQEWLGRKLDATEWGWLRDRDGDLRPLPTLDQAAPTSVLSTIFCCCTKGCSARCSCRKSGIHCSTICSNCEGVCSNSPPLENDADDDDPDDLVNSFDDIN